MPTQILGHSRDALLRSGASLTRVRPKLRKLAEQEDIRPTDPRDLATAIDETVRLAARDIVLDALIGALSDLEREVLLQLAVSGLAIERDDLQHAIVELTPVEQLSAAINRLVSISLVAETDDGLWVHRWTAEALRQQQPLDEYRAHCRRAGELRLARLLSQQRDVTEGIEATQNFLDAGAFDQAAAISLEVCDFLAHASTLDLASFARHVRQALPPGHDAYKHMADHEARSLLALGDTNTAMLRYVELVDDHERLVASEPDRADYQRDLSVSYNKLGDLHRALGQGDQAGDRYTKSLEISERLAASEPDRADYQRDLSISYTRLASCAVDAGDSEAARAFFQADLHIARQLLDLQPDTADAAIDLAISLVQISDFEDDPTASRTQATALLARLQHEGRLNAQGVQLLVELQSGQRQVRSSGPLARWTAAAQRLQRRRKRADR